MTMLNDDDKLPATCSWSLYFTIPTWGLRVVNGYAATAGLALEMALKSEDLPAFGNPTWHNTYDKNTPEYISYVEKPYAFLLTSPAWAMVRSSSWRTRSWPVTPGVAVIGARFSFDRKNRFPFPPAPPNTAKYSWPWSARSTIVLPCSFTTVPTGTCTNGNIQSSRGAWSKSVD